MQPITDIILDEGKWVAGSMILASGATALVVARQWRQGWSRFEIRRAMSLSYGCMIGAMGSGHLIAVTVKAAQERLGGSLILMWLLGLSLAIPGWWLVWESVRTHVPAEWNVRRVVCLNLFLVLALVVLGPHNAPLAVPGVLAIAYELHTRRKLGWAIAALAAAANTGLLIGAVAFAASGQSFEQFRGID